MYKNLIVLILILTGILNSSEYAKHQIDDEPIVMPIFHENKFENINYAVVESANGKVMQDKHAIIEGDDFFFAGVFDGHGSYGDSMAEYVAKNIFSNIQNCCIENDFKKSIFGGFLKTNVDIKNKFPYSNLWSGSTASTILIKPNKIYLSWIGDSTIVFSENNNVLSTFNHKIYKDNIEFKRIKNLYELLNPGKEIESANNFLVSKMKDYYRLGCGLSDVGIAISRSFGDFICAPYLVAEPAIYETSLQNEYVILASDGLWDVVSFRYAYDFIKSKNINGDKKKLEQAAKELLNHALEAWKAYPNTDNIIIMIIDLNHYNIIS